MYLVLLASGTILIIKLWSYYRVSLY